MKDELVQLDSVYRSPGILLLARDDGGERLGCVGLRHLDGLDGLDGLTESTGELRRLFVRPQGRGTGLGRALTERALEQAASAGMTRVVLNTLPSMVEAIALYEALGFRSVAPYVAEPIDEVRYFALDLASARP